MRHADLDTVVSTIDSLLAGALDQQQMPAAMERMRHLFGGSKACFARFGPNLSEGDAVATNQDRDFDKRVYGELAPEAAVLAQRVGRVPIGEVFQDHEVHGKDQLRANRFWREWMAPQDMYAGMGCRVAEGGQSFWFFDVQRGRKQTGFDEVDLALFERLTPVMRRFADLRHHIGVLEIQRDMARCATDALSVAIMIVDRSLQLSYANAMADEIFAEPNGALSMRGGRIFARNPRDQKTLRQLVAETSAETAAATGKRTHLLTRATGTNGSAVSLCVMPMPAGYGLSDNPSDVMIVARTLAPAGELAAAAQELFMLTEAEAQFASALASGLSLAGAAEDQGVRISTARTHLARIFQKTGTRQQSQVAALLRSAELPLRDRKAK